MNINTWIIEHAEERGILGIICEHLHYVPFNKLNGEISNDRIVLYTFIINN